MLSIKYLLLLLASQIIVSSKLVQVLSIFRHGARYQLGGGYDPTTPDQEGELTGVGMRQHQTLGQILRKEYIENLGFLSAQYNRKEIEVYSTTTNRTVESALSQLYGLYPLGSGPRLTLVNLQYHLPPYNNKTDDPEQNFALPNGYQEIPIKFNPKFSKESCQNQAEQKKKNKEANIAVYNQMNVTYYPFIQKLIPMFNLSANATLETLSSLTSRIQVSIHMNHKLPANFTQDDFKNLKHIRSWINQFEYVGNLTKAKNKYKLDKIISMFDGRTKIITAQDIKWSFLSAHDLHIVPLFTDLNISSYQCIEELYRKGETSALNCQSFPEFATSMIFELYEDSRRNFTIKLRVDGKYMNLCGKKSTECKYDQWKDRVKKNLASDAMAIQICGSVADLLDQQQDILIQ